MKITAHLIANGYVPILTGSEPAETWIGLTALIVVGMLAITKGGDLFTDSSVDLARMTHVPPVIVGATIVSMATSFPEFMVSLTGVLAGSAEFAVGNAIGSCLCNIGLIIGVCAVTQGFLARRNGTATGIEAAREMLSGPGMFMLATTAMLFAFSLFSAGHAMSDGQPAQFGVARWQAGILFLGMFVYLGYSIRNARAARYEAQLAQEEKLSTPTARQLIRTMTVFAAASLIVVAGSRLLVCNGEELALRLGVPKLVLGLTLFAVGTSLPELAISLIAVLKGHEALGIGNIIGSNILNITWVLASCALVRPLPIDIQTVAVDLPVTLLLTVLLLVLPWKAERISPGAGAVLLAIYLAHLIGITAAGIL